jgi:two-component sensor histidine kinase
LFAHEVIGQELAWGKNSHIDHSLKTGEIVRDAEPEMMGDVLVKEETVPVYFEGKTIAVISRHRNAVDMRSASRLEINYRELAHKIYAMIAEGKFPIQNAIYGSESAPRVGDGLIRLNQQGEIVYASPNGRSVLNKAGWTGEVLGSHLGEIFDEVSGDNANPVDETWGVKLEGITVRREEFENDRGVFDILAIPLEEKSQHIGAIVLLHNVTELRRRDRALISKDATIREIHHRVKNNLQTVSALLRLQSRRVDDPAASAALAEAVRRVASIAIVHETLSAGPTQDVPFDEVLNRIVHNAVELSTHPISIEKVGEFGFFESAVATPLSLVVTELIHNALEHGLDSEGDYLKIVVERTPDKCNVQVIDNGVGLPDDFSWDESSNLGLQIVKTLTENELKGSISLSRINNETVGNLIFPTR